MKTISQAELAKMTSGGAKVRRQMGAAQKKEAAPQKPKPVEKKPVEMASMGASMKHLETQAQATLKVLAMNTEVIKEFRKDLGKVADQVGKKVPYVFDVERSDDRLIKRIVATPQTEN